MNLKWLIPAGLCCAATASGGPEPGLYTIDTAHSSITFTVGHTGVSRVSGRLDGVSGSFEITQDGIREVIASIDPATVYTGHEKRDEHLRNDDFFGVENHGSLQFRARSIQAFGGGRYAVEGELILLGTTRPVNFEAREVASKSGTYQGKTFHMVGYTGKGTLRRSDFGMDFAVGTVTDQVEYDLFIEAVYIEEEPKATH